MIQQSHSWARYLDKTRIQKGTCSPVFTRKGFLKRGRWS